MREPFHEVLFPLSVALGGSGGPERKTEIVTMGSGREERTQRWARSRRRYDAGSGVKSLTELQAVLAFFEERRGRLYGFRWRDRLDSLSSAPGAAPGPGDQSLATGDGATTAFPLTKTYGGAFLPYVRPITKPVAGSVRVAVAGQEAVTGTDFSVDPTTGLVTFAVPPASGAAITAGFVFDVPVRFDTDQLLVDFSAFIAGEIPKIPLVELIL